MAIKEDTVKMSGTKLQGPSTQPVAPTAGKQADKREESHIKFITSNADRETAKATLIGESESFEKLMNVKAFKEVNMFLEEGEHVWKPWFKSLSLWSPQLQLNKRIASIIVYGVPMHAWCEESFSVIARKWGDVLIPESCDTDNLNLAFGRIGILTDHSGLISTSLSIIVDGVKYKINVLEDVFESNRLNPMLASIDVNDQFEFDKWESHWREEGFGSEDEYQEGESPESSPENPWCQITGENIKVGETNRQEDNHYRDSESRTKRAEAHASATDSWENESYENREVARGAMAEHQMESELQQDELDFGPNNLGLDKNLAHGPDLDKKRELGQSLLTRSKSLDLNVNPNCSSSGESRTWKPRSNNVSQLSDISCPSINQTNDENPAISLDKSQEIEATMGIGEAISFQFGGNQAQAKKLLNKRGAIDVNQ
ncbi:hypothetical protein L2E82_10720 [Cichorium intybus]|uniref:Uncharacterized protein n=1 Tax=Cichorium intybus TaxID=13427 RepID=A0ACB9GDB6_CICIN|nr:hypothetical protein L2E82_10720 [Cichorium intybus]